MIPVQENVANNIKTKEKGLFSGSLLGENCPPLT